MRLSCSACSLVKFALTVLCERRYGLTTSPYADKDVSPKIPDVTPDFVLTSIRVPHLPIARRNLMLQQRDMMASNGDGSGVGISSGKSQSPFPGSP